MTTLGVLHARLAGVVSFGRDLPDVLTEIVQISRSAMPGVDAASITLIRDDRPSRDCKARLNEAHAPTPHPLRRMTPQSTEHLFQHSPDNIKGKLKR